MGNLCERGSQNVVFEYHFLLYTTLPFSAIFESMSAILTSWLASYTKRLIIILILLLLLIVIIIIVILLLLLLLLLLFLLRIFHKIVMRITSGNRFFCLQMWTTRTSDEFLPKK